MKSCKHSHIISVISWTISNGLHRFHVMCIHTAVFLFPTVLIFVFGERDPLTILSPFRGHTDRCSPSPFALATGAARPRTQPRSRQRSTSLSQHWVGASLSLPSSSHEWTAAGGTHMPTHLPLERFIKPQAPSSLILTAADGGSQRDSLSHFFPNVFSAYFVLNTFALFG